MKNLSPHSALQANALWLAFEKAASRYAQRESVRVDDKRVAYAQLLERAKERAYCISSDGLHVPLEISMPKNLELVETLLAYSKLGRPWLYLDPADSPAAGRTEGTLYPSNQDVGCLIQTSGTTGRPKWVPMMAAAMAQNACQFARSLSIVPDDRVAWLASPTVAATNSALWGALLHGACLCPFSVREAGLSRLADWIRKESISVLHLTPTLLRSLLNVAEGDSLRSLRAIKLGGEALRTADYKKFRAALPSSCRLFNGLGMSEAGGNVCHIELTELTPDIDGVLPVGRPLPGHDCLLLDAEGHPLANGETGELAISSPWLMPGYLGDHDADPFITLPDGRCALRTGDIASRGHDEVITIHGRSDRRIKLRGYSVDLDGLESMLRSYPNVQDAAVKFFTQGERHILIAHLEPYPASHVTIADIKAKLPSHLQSIELNLVTSLPRTASGKIDHTALSSTRINQTGIGARNEQEAAVATCWSTVLKRGDFDVYENFFDAGGDSLAAIELLAQLERQSGRKLNPEWLIKNATIAQMAGQLARKSNDVPLWRKLIRCFAWEQMPLRTGENHHPWLVVPGGYAGENELLVFAQLFRVLGNSTAAHGLKIRRGRGWKSRPINYETSIKALCKAVNFDKMNGCVKVIGECVASPLAIGLSIHFSRIGVDHHLILMEPTAPSGRIASDPSPVMRKRAEYYRQLHHAKPGSYDRPVTVLHTDEILDEDKLRNLWGKSLMDAPVTAYRVPGNHESYLRQHRLELAKRLSEISGAT